MKAIAIVLAVISLVALPAARADSITGSVQQALKDQGFYYGNVTGTKDADTTAAIRRYQIRNGLQITGEINAETQKSLGLKGNVPPARATAPPRIDRSTPPPARATPPPSDLRDDAADIQNPPLRDPGRPSQPAIPAPGYAPGPRGLVPETSGIFDDTPYEVAPPDLQRRVIVGAQSLLARQGYYRSGIDGVYGRGMEFAVRAYQTEFGIEPSGRLDMETLAALGLLPGERAPGITAPRGSFFRRPGIFAPRGERVYTPR